MEAYKQRMIIEYRELKERADKLATMLDKWDKGTLDFTPTCPMYLLENQLETMKDYVGILQTRAKLEDVDLNASVDDAPVEKAGWIPVTERMPEEHEWLGTKRFGTTKSDEVYVTFENPKGERFCRHLSFQNGKLSAFDQSTIDAFFKGSRPVAWMPLPEPSKEESND